jgi:hypothetical protein
MHTPPSDLPPELKAFLYSCVDSVEQVEILMLLRRSERAWTARGVTVELGLVERVARAQLETLTSRGLVRAETGGAEVAYRYQPKTAQLRRYADLLADSYGTARTAIYRFISTNVRRSKRFADAFKLRDQDRDQDQ